ncbi:Angiogenic factor with G patch and FHA domains 1 [Cichlidogyrus casuarinus]|uniref:Angiogenic factor with G patch and FHA domains 1 n=1 Tax=Cichlidogyrus casuarinus TaxID=1844966 RepID=A0ABD2PUA4_9PLAT
MEFDLFDKLSELETKLQMLQEDLETRDMIISQLKSENKQLREKLEKMTNSQIAPPGTETADCYADELQLDSMNNDSKAPFALYSGSTLLYSLEIVSLADQLKEASESVTQATGYVMDPKTGLYYDQNSGYYYDPENQLFFEPRNGVFYSYCKATGQYKLQSTVSPEELKVLMTHNNLKAAFQSVANNARLKIEKAEEREEKRHKRHMVRYSSSRSRSSSSDRGKKKRKHKRSRRRSSSGSDKPVQIISSSAVKYPPVVRLIVLSSKFYRPGKLSIVTNKDAETRWATIGRSSCLCPVLHFERDADIDEIHCEILIGKKDEKYFIKDKKSESGTFLNGVQLEQSKKEPLKHGDILRIGTNKLLVHIHNGTETCEQCLGDPSADEPIPEEVSQSEDLDGIPLDVNEIKSLNKTLYETNKKDLEATRLANIKALKAKYALNEDLTARTEELAKGSGNQYRDRAANRRKGEVTTEPEDADLPRLLPPLSLVEKTNKASVDKPISEDNKGAKLLSKMGWTPGSGLGKNKSGIAEPIRVDQRKTQYAGLGRDPADRVSQQSSNQSEVLSD